MQTCPYLNTKHADLTRDFSHDQLVAFDECLDSNTRWNSLTGFSGSGKTALATALAEVYRCSDRTLQLTATTNKAASILAEKIGEPVPTWQSFLGFTLEKQNDGQLVLKKTRKSKLTEGAILAIDEASMISFFDLKNILKEVETKNAQVLFIGDPWQLLPVKGKGSPALSGALSKSKLTTLHRQVEGSPIIKLSHDFRKVLDGSQFPDATQYDGPTFGKFTGVKYIADRAEFEKKRLDYFLLADDPNDVKSLHYKNSASVKVSNEIYAAKFDRDPTKPHAGEFRIVNSAVEDENALIFGTDETVFIEAVEPSELCFIEGYHCTLSGINTASVFVPQSWEEAHARLKEKQREGNRLNRIVKENPTNENKRLKSQAWWNYYELKNALVDLRLPFACTVHKSQGSTYNTVFIDLSEIGTCTNPATIARLLYVGISRARESVFITGNLPARLDSYNREVNF